MSESKDAVHRRPVVNVLGSGHRLLGELLDQVELYACSGAIWTQTTDVEGEVNGLTTYDRRVLRPDVSQWQADIQSLYDAAAARSNASIPA